MIGDLARNKSVCLSRDGLAALLARLREQGYQLVGPTLSDGAIVYAELGGREDLPEGWTDEQGGGTYRLARRDDSALFGYVVGPQSWKQFLFPPVLPQFKATRELLQIEPATDPQDLPPFAFIGVRSCELAAMEVQDRVFLNGEYTDSVYQGRRQRAFILAVNCGQAGGTCFCASMNTGPRARSGFDLALTEVIGQDTHYFVTEVGSERGADALKDVPQRPADAADLDAAAKISARAALQMGRELDTTDIRELLYRNLDHPRWDDVAHALPELRQLHHGLPHLFLFHGRGRYGPHGIGGPATQSLGFLFHG